jgi:hypothetical protein
VTAEGVNVKSANAAKSTSEVGLLSHDGTDVILNNNHGGIKVTVGSQKTQGTLTCTDIPHADTVLVVDDTTYTAKASGATGNQFNIGATLALTLANLLAAINASAETATSWSDDGTSLVVEWDVAGTVGNSKTFTTTLTHCSLTGAGTLGGPGATHTGVAGSTLIDADQGGVVTISGIVSGNSLLTTSLDNGAYSGQYLSATVDTNATGVGACLYVGTDGHYDDAIATSLAAVKCRAVALEAGTGTKLVLIRGFVRNTGWSFDIGADIFVSASAGVITKTAPTTAGQFVKRVGYAVSADTIYFDSAGSVIGL